MLQLETNAMKRLHIKNFGPVKEANLTLGRVNIITGLQSHSHTAFPYSLSLELIV